MANIRSDFFDVGLYKLSEASMLTNINSQKLNRYFFGYSRLGKKYNSISPSEIIFDGQKTLSFRDLIEALAVNKFLLAGVSVKTLRKVSKKFSENIGSHPFSSKKLETDGKNIFEREQEELIWEVLGDQGNFFETIKESLIPIEYEDDVPVKWWITHKNPSKGSVVLDPKRSFGQPIIDEISIPTLTLFNGVLSNKDAQDKFLATSIDFDVCVDFVKQAFKFESDRHAPHIH